MKKWMALFLLFVVYYSTVHSPEMDVESVLPAEESEIVSPISQLPLPKKNLPRLPANHAVKKLPFRVNHHVPKQNALKIGKNFVVVDDVVALDKKIFDEKLGQRVHEDKFFTYYRPVDRQHSAHPVAFDRISQGFHPISHILHVKNVTEEIRQYLSDLGLKEYYFHSRMKLLSVAATPTTVLSQYHQLKKNGLDVRLEVLKDVHQAK